MTNLVIFFKDSNFIKKCILSQITIKKKALPEKIQKGLLNFKKIYQTLISTSTPEGNSSFIKASTVLAEAL